MNFEQFIESARGNFRLQLESYKETQLRRRINSFMQKHKVQEYKEFLELLKNRQDIYEAFLNHLTINVSEFFRDQQKFAELENVHIPYLLKNKNSLKIWSAACSNGAEPYSVAMILEKLSPGNSHTIIATDVDRDILQQAKQGEYKPDAVKNINKDRLSRYFSKHEQVYRVSNNIKNKVKFKQHDLLQDRYEGGFDLILCRNVTIYFTRKAQDRINQGFAGALANGGILFIGASEMIFNYQQLNLEKISPCFYMKKR